MDSLFFLSFSPPCCFCDYRSGGGEEPSGEKFSAWIKISLTPPSFEKISPRVESIRRVPESPIRVLESGQLFLRSHNETLSVTAIVHQRRKVSTSLTRI
jgi:hypothetical protein